jgi:flagellar FliL protein
MAAKPKKLEPEQEPEESAAEGEAATPAAAGKASLIRKAIFAGAALLLLGGVGGGVYYFFFMHKTEEKVAAPAVKPPAFFDLPEVLVNLSNTGAERTQYLKVKVVLELSDAKVEEQIKPVLPRVMDTFQTFLREMRPSDLEGSAGLYRMREELTRRVNTAIAPSHINAVLFKEIVVQ